MGSTIGKKGDTDCTKDFTVLSGPCPISIVESGRYVLEEDLICGQDLSGIKIKANDVLLDCKNNQITGSAGEFTVGIDVSGSEHVTVTNCNVRQFYSGLYANEFFCIGRWRDLVVENSAFNQNAFEGMQLGGSSGESVVTVVGSQFNNNGAYGVSLQSVSGTFISSEMNGNLGTMDFEGIGFREFGTTSDFLKLIDVTTNQNGAGGIINSQDTKIEIIKSTACDNDAAPEIKVLGDMALGNNAVTQGNTCDTSFPNDRKICECTCNGGSKSSTITSISSDMDTTNGNSPTFLVCLLHCFSREILSYFKYYELFT